MVRLSLTCVFREGRGERLNPSPGSAQEKAALVELRTKHGLPSEPWKPDTGLLVSPRRCTDTAVCK